MKGSISAQKTKEITEMKKKIVIWTYSLKSIMRDWNKHLRVTKMLSIQEGLLTSVWVSVNVSCFQNRHHKGFKKLKEATQFFLDQVIYKKLQFKIGYRKKKVKFILQYTYSKQQTEEQLFLKRKLCNETNHKRFACLFRDQH